MKLTIAEVIEQHSRQGMVEQAEFMVLIRDDMPELYEFMYALKSKFGRVSMPKLSKPGTFVPPTKRAVEYIDPFITPTGEKSWLK